MSRGNKLTYDIIKEYINNNITGNGCSIITTKDDFELEKDRLSKACTLIKIEIKCSCGDIFITNFNNFKSYNKKQCNKCGKMLMIDSKKLNYNDVKYFIENESNSGCKLISESYIKATEKLNIQCKCGIIYSASYAKFKYGNQRECPKCSHIRRIAERSSTFDEVKYYIETESNSDCKLLSKKYLGIIKNLEIKCKCGEIFYTSFNNFLNRDKHQCDKCSEIKRKLNCIQKWGFDNPMKNKEVSAKVRDTLFKNNNAPRSNQQIYIHQLIGGEINYPYYNASLDIAFPEEKLYIEYDGGGHCLTIKLGQITQNEFDKKQRNRWYSLYRSGWKSVNIISRNDNLPSDQIILEMLSYARTYLINHHYIKFDIDNNKIINSQGEFDFDYGELRKIKLTDLKEAI